MGKYLIMVIEHEVTLKPFKVKYGASTVYNIYIEFKTVFD